MRTRLGRATFLRCAVPVVLCALCVAALAQDFNVPKLIDADSSYNLSFATETRICGDWEFAPVGSGYTLRAIGDRPHQLFIKGGPNRYNFQHELTPPALLLINGNHMKVSRRGGIKIKTE